jgi:hypothetical protein
MGDVAGGRPKTAAKVTCATVHESDGGALGKAGAESIPSRKGRSMKRPRHIPLALLGVGLAAIVSVTAIATAPARVAVE